MAKIEPRVQHVFDKKLKDWNLERTLNEFEMNAIKRALQEAYELGHADGFSEAWYQYNELEEENGNL